MEQRPPIWLVVVLALEILFALLLLYVGMSFSGAQMRPADILIYLAPLLFVLASGGLSWWLWMAGRRGLSVASAVIAPLLLLFALVIVAGVGF